MEKLKNIEFLRVFLISVIVFLHTTAYGAWSLLVNFPDIPQLKTFHKIFIQGNNGVEGFFIIAGFLLIYTLKNQSVKDFIKKNEQNEKLSKPLIPEECLSNIKSILTKEPKKEAIINVADNWTIQSQKDNGRFPNDNEWHRFMSSPLNGRIGMSFALQWRYNFSQIFSGFKK